MNKVMVKPLKSSRQKEKKLSKKIKNLTKEGILEEGINYFDSNVKAETKNVINDEDLNMSVDIDSSNIINVDTKEEESIDCHKTVIENSKFNVVILNLPFDASHEELSNFLSKRGIPVDALSLENGKYAVIESSDVNSFEQIRKSISNKSLVNSENMVASKLLGNFQRLETLCPKDSILNRSIIIVKNINSQTIIDDILCLIPSDIKIKKHQFIKHYNKKMRTAMIELIDPLNTDHVIDKLNGTIVDGNKLVAEFKHRLVEETECNKVFTLRIGNLSDATSYDTIKNLELNCSKMQLTKKSGKRVCFITFKSNKDLTDAYERLLNKEIDGNKIDVKLVEYKFEKSEADFDLTKLHITNLPYNCTKEQIEKEFEMAASMKFPLNNNGKSKGCCYLSFESKELAALALEGLKDKVINGRKIKCEYTKRNQDVAVTVEKNKKEKRPKKRVEGNVITLFNLPRTVTVDEIKAKFEHVKFVHIIKKDNIFKGIAEVHFIKPDFAKAAFEANSFKMNGREVRKELKGGKWRDRVVTNSRFKPKKEDVESGGEDSD